MKIGETQNINRPTATSATKGATPVAKPTGVKPVDEVVWRGIPDAELTPKVRAALMTLFDEVRALRAELDNARERVSELETLADRDPMLDILNRRAFTRELDRALAMIDRYEVRSSLVFVDLNDLKKINDRMGHQAGDAALTHIANLISENIRQTDVFARLGGDEFAILLVQADELVASAKATQIARLIAETPVSWSGDAFAASVSWGAVEIRKGQSAQEAMYLADEAMYEAKRVK